MRYAHISQADLNLLAGFQALVEERSITLAARRMCLSQPAMSRVFDRLQGMFKDQLLVRTPKGYEATRRALHIYSQLERVLPQLEHLLRGEEFDPIEAADRFRIAATDHLAIVLLPKIMEQLASTRKMEIEVVAWNEDVFHRLDTNTLDLVLWVNEAPPTLRTAALYEDEFVCLVRTNHPLLKRRLTLKRYLEHKHLVVSLTDGRQGLLELALHKLGHRRDAQLKVPYFGAVGPIIERTDMIATLPRRLATRLSATSNTCITPAPIELPTLTHIQVWHPRDDSDPAHKWLRTLVQRIAAID